MQTSDRLDRGVDRSWIVEGCQGVLNGVAVRDAQRSSRRHPYGRVRVPHAGEGRFHGIAGRGIGQPLQREGPDVPGWVGHQLRGEDRRSLSWRERELVEGRTTGLRVVGAEELAQASRRSRVLDDADGPCGRRRCDRRVRVLDPREESLAR